MVSTHGTSIGVYLKRKGIPKEVALKFAEKYKVIGELCGKLDYDNIDLYRSLGTQVIRLQLINELQDYLMRYVNRYHTIKVWPKELWELRVNCLKLMELTQKMIRALIANGNKSGIYKKDDIEKEV